MPSNIVGLSSTPQKYTARQHHPLPNGSISIPNFRKDLDENPAGNKAPTSTVRIKYESPASAWSRRDLPQSQPNSPSSRISATHFSTFNNRIAGGGAVLQKAAQYDQKIRQASSTPTATVTSPDGTSRTLVDGLSSYSGVVDKLVTRYQTQNEIPPARPFDPTANAKGISNLVGRRPSVTESVSSQTTKADSAVNSPTTNQPPSRISSPPPLPAHLVAAALANAKSVETKPVESRSAETKPAASNPADIKTARAIPAMVTGPLVPMAEIPDAARRSLADMRPETHHVPTHSNEVSDSFRPQLTSLRSTSTVSVRQRQDGAYVLTYIVSFPDLPNEQGIDLAVHDCMTQTDEKILFGEARTYVQTHMRTSISNRVEALRKAQGENPISLLNQYTVKKQTAAPNSFAPTAPYQARPNNIQTDSHTSAFRAYSPNGTRRESIHSQQRIESTQTSSEQRSMQSHETRSYQFENHSTTHRSAS